MIQVLVAFGFTGAIMIYVIGDASRFLISWVDRLLYLISCLLMKPILLPILLPGNFFQSYVATSQFDGRERVIVDGVETTTFMLAVQETNFLLSFTLSSFSAMATALTSIPEETEDPDKYSALIILLAVSVVYCILGFTVSVLMYGRKTSHDPDALNKKTKIYKDGRSP